jgi:hypothetical protein
VTRNNSASPAFLGAMNRTQHTTYTNTRGHACFSGLPSRYVSGSNSGPGPEQKNSTLERNRRLGVPNPQSQNENRSQHTKSSRGCSRIHRRQRHAQGRMRLRESGKVDGTRYEAQPDCGGLGETSNEVRTIHATSKHGARGIGKQQLPKKDNGETMKKTKTRRYKTWLQQQWRHRVPLQSEGQQLHHYVPKKPHTLQAYSADSPTKTHTSLRLES